MNRIDGLYLAGFLVVIATVIALMPAQCRCQQAPAVTMDQTDD